MRIMGWPYGQFVYDLLVYVIPSTTAVILFWFAFSSQTRVQRLITKSELLDDTVYQYILGKNGSIIVSKAATDLVITADELMKCIQRLENNGKIKIMETSNK